YVFLAISSSALYTLSLHDALPILQPFSGGNTFNLYVRDMLTQTAKLATISPDGKSDARNSDGNDVPIHDAAISGDGRFVVFVTRDRKSTRLNSSHQIISYAVFCLK